MDLGYQAGVARAYKHSLRVDGIARRFFVFVLFMNAATCSVAFVRWSCQCCGNWLAGLVW